MSCIVNMQLFYPDAATMVEWRSTVNAVHQKLMRFESSRRD